MLSGKTNPILRLVDSWRDHLARPQSLGDLRRLIAEGPAPTPGRDRTPLRDLQPAGSGPSDLDGVEEIPRLSAADRSALRAAGYVSVGDLRAATREDIRQLETLSDAGKERLCRGV